MLEAARQARGVEWKPKGSAQEGEVMRRMHDDATVLSPGWEAWDGAADPRRAFGPLEKLLAARRIPSRSTIY